MRTKERKGEKFKKGQVPFWTGKDLRYIEDFWIQPVHIDIDKNHVESKGVIRDDIFRIDTLAIKMLLGSGEIVYFYIYDQFYNAVYTQTKDSTSSKWILHEPVEEKPPYEMSEVDEIFGVGVTDMCINFQDIICSTLDRFIDDGAVNMFLDGYEEIFDLLVRIATIYNIEVSSNSHVKQVFERHKFNVESGSQLPKLYIVWNDDLYLISWYTGTRKLDTPSYAATVLLDHGLTLSYDGEYNINGIEINQDILVLT